MARQVDQALVDEIGTRIRALREARGLTQEALAEAGDVHPETMSRIERGRMQATVTVLGRLAAALDCRISDFVDIHEPSGSEVRTEAELLRHFRRLQPDARDHLLRLLAAL